MTVKQFFTYAAMLLFMTLQAEEAQTRITVCFDQVSLRTALEQLSQKSGIAFVFSDQLVADYEVSLQADSLNLNAILDSLLIPVKISHKKVKNGPIVLYQAKKMSADVSGWIVDASSGKALPFANIQLEGSGMGTASDASGYFKLSDVPIPDGRLKVSHIGYESETLKVKPEKSMHIALQERPVRVQHVSVSANTDLIRLSGGDVEGAASNLPDIRTIPSVTSNDVMQTLQYAPVIGTISDKSSEFYILGGTPDQNLLTVESIPIYHDNHYFGFFSPFSMPPIQAVKVYETHIPACYEGRLSSLFQLDVGNAPKDNLKLQFDMDFFQAGLYVEKRLAENFSGFLSYKRSHKRLENTWVDRDIEAFIKSAVTAESELWEIDTRSRPISFSDWITGFFHRLPWKTSVLKCTMLGSYEEEEEETERIRTDFQDNHYLEETQRSSTWQNIGLSAELIHFWTSDLITQATYSTAKYDQKNSYIRFFDGRRQSLENTDGFSDRIYSQRLDFKTTYTHNQLLKIAVGATYFDESFDLKRDFYPQTETVDRLSLYTSAGWRLSDQLDIKPGFRFTRSPHNKDWFAEPRILFAYQFSAKFKCDFVWDHRHQFVSRLPDPLFKLGQSGSIWIVSDDKIKPGFVEHASFSCAYQANKQSRMSFGVYQRTFENLTDYTSVDVDQIDKNDVPFIFGSGQARGFFLTLSRKTALWDGYISYHNGSVKHTFPDLYGGQSFPAEHERPHQLKGVSTLYFGKWSLTFAGVFASGARYTAIQDIGKSREEFTTYYQPGVTGINQASLDAYKRLDISLKRTGKVKNLSIQFGAAFLNVFDTENVQSRYYQQDFHTSNYVNVELLGFTPTAFLSVGWGKN